MASIAVEIGLGGRRWDDGERKSESGPLSKRRERALGHSPCVVSLLVVIVAMGGSEKGTSGPHKCAVLLGRFSAPDGSYRQTSPRLGPCHIVRLARNVPLQRDQVPASRDLPITVATRREFLVTAFFAHLAGDADLYGKVGSAHNETRSRAQGDFEPEGARTWKIVLDGSS